MDKVRVFSIALISITVILGILAIVRNMVLWYYLFLVVFLVTCIVWVYRYIMYTFRKKHMRDKSRKIKK